MYRAGKSQSPMGQDGETEGKSHSGVAMGCVAQEEVTQSPRGGETISRLRMDRPREAGPHPPLLVTPQLPPTPNKFQPNFRASSGDSL